MVRVELEDVVVSVGGCVDIDCEEIFKVLRVASAFFSLFFSFLKNQNFFKAEFVCVCVCVCVSYSNENTTSFLRSGFNAREKVRLKKITARRVFHRRRATMAASVLITCYNISERALATSPEARARFEVLFKTLHRRGYLLRLLCPRTKKMMMKKKTMR